MRRDDPDLFKRYVALERLLNDRRTRLRCSASGRPATVYVIDDYGAGPEAGKWSAETGHDKPLEPGTQQRCGCGQLLTIDPDGPWPEHHKSPVYLTRFGRPLDQAIAEAQPSLFGADGPETCDDGHCWT